MNAQASHYLAPLFGFLLLAGCSGGAGEPGGDGDGDGDLSTGGDANGEWGDGGGVGTGGTVGSGGLGSGGDLGSGGEGSGGDFGSGGQSDTGGAPGSGGVAELIIPRQGSVRLEKFSRVKRNGNATATARFTRRARSLREGAKDFGSTSPLAPRPEGAREKHSTTPLKREGERLDRCSLDPFA